MRIIGCDLHSRQHTLAMLETATGEVAKKTLKHEDDNVREFYSTLPGPVRAGIEATASFCSTTNNRGLCLRRLRVDHALFGN
jgi:hypothetical protein